MSPKPSRKRLPHEIPFWVESGSVFFVTVCCADRTVNSLASNAVFDAMTSAWHHYAFSGKAWTRLFLAMPDHLHALISFAPDTSITKIVRDWKRYIARNNRVDWQTGFFDHRLRNSAAFDEKAAYIRANPVRAGLVSTPAEWPFVWSADDLQPAR
jgi:REP element-mobilizing transposase RayT